MRKYTRKNNRKVTKRRKTKKNHTKKIRGGGIKDSIRRILGKIILTKEDISKFYNPKLSTDVAQEKLTDINPNYNRSHPDEIKEEEINYFNYVNDPPITPTFYSGHIKYEKTLHKMGDSNPPYDKDYYEEKIKNISGIGKFIFTNNKSTKDKILSTIYRPDFKCIPNIISYFKIPNGEKIIGRDYLSDGSYLSDDKKYELYGVWINDEFDSGFITNLDDNTIYFGTLSNYPQKIQDNTNNEANITTNNELIDNPIPNKIIKYNDEKERQKIITKLLSKK
jgi:hypothetical protein